jgi:hypothetical protein
MLESYIDNEGAKNGAIALPEERDVDDLSRARLPSLRLLPHTSSVPPSSDLDAMDDAA